MENDEKEPKKEIPSADSDALAKDTGDGTGGPDVYVSQELDEKENRSDLDKLSKLIADKNVSSLRSFVSEHDPIDLAYLVNDLNNDADLVYLFKAAPNQYMARVFSYLDADQQAKIVKAFTNKEVQPLISGMAADDLVDFVEELPSNLVRKVLQNTDPADRQQINTLLNYKEDTAGSIMTTEYVSIKDSASCEQALTRIKKIGREAETIVTTYVVDQTRHLIGALTLQDLVFADETKPVIDIMDDDCVSCVADADQEEVASLMKKYDLTVIPVVDKEKRMLGIITIDDIIDVIESEQTEDLSKMAAVSPIESDYLKTKVWTQAKSRIPWLLILMISGTFTGLIINSFESMLAVLPILTVFIPMLMDTGGNAGGQTTTVVTRALSLGQISFHDFLKVLFNEFKIACIVGLAVAAVNFLWIYFEIWIGLISYTSASVNPIWMISLLVSVTVFAVIVASKTIGSILPLLAKRVHIDPAIMAGPVITTIVDAGSLSIYFALALLILKNL